MIETSRYIQAVVNLPELPEDQLYDYKVPKGWNFIPPSGCRILVPFGRRKVEAVVWGNQKPTYDPEQIKEIIAILDDTPLLNKNQISLIEWMAQRFFCRRQDLLHLFSPPGSNVKTEKCWRLIGEPTEVEEFLKNIPIPDQVRSKLSEQLQKLTPEFTVFPTSKPEFIPYITQLIDAGLIEVSWRLSKPKVRFKRALAYTLVPQESIEIEKTLTEKQRKVYQYLSSQNKSLTSNQILSATGVSTSVLTALHQKGVVKKEPIIIERNPFLNQPSPKPIPVLNDEQRIALDQIFLAITQNEPAFFLLHGVTGSGKTEVYLRAIDKIIKKGKEAIFLVPEISLTPQTVERVRARFGKDVAVLHSSLSDGERFDQWWRIKKGKVKVVVGARSAIFAPLPNLGMIIIDEEHEYTYKQEEVPRYHVREVAKEICRRINGILIMGSATPSLESIYEVRKGELKELVLSERVMGRPMPEIRVIDLRQEFKNKRFSVLSPPLQREVEERLSLNEQVIILLNRRGYATFIICRECGHVLKCPACDVSLTYHQKPGILRCHYCDYQATPPNICPQCRSHYIRYFGHGTQRLEEELKKEFPTARVARMDLDSTIRKGSHEKLYRQLVKGEIDILLGTQMVAKGLDLPKVTLVGIITADSALNLPDFRAAERTYQILTQASGRSGRGEKPGTVVIQTYNPDHYSIKSLVDQEEATFYQKELFFREAADYPPFTHLIRLVFSGPDLTNVMTIAEQVTAQVRKEIIRIEPGNKIEVIGPQSAVIEKIKNRFRWHTLIKTSKLSIFQQLLPKIISEFSGKRKQGVRIIIDENPYSVL